MMKSETVEKLKQYGLTLFLTILCLCLMIFSLDLYPVGNKVLLWTDSDQYMSIQHYFGSITGKNDIFYSWSCVLGGNALPQLAYYAFSPFNILFMFLGNHMIFAAHAVAYSKITCASLTFCYCLRDYYKDNSILMKSLMSVCYSFMGYIIFYSWNTSWMDGVILLPILFVGIRKIICGKNALQYVLTLALALISNFYIGYMICITSVILYIASLLLYEKSFLNGLRKSFITYALSSLFGGGLAAFLLIPTFLGLPETRKLSVLDAFKDMSITVNPMVMMSGFFAGQQNDLGYNAPMIFIGLLPFILVVLFFVCKKANNRKKMVYMALIITFMLSFENNFINRIWHGMSDNVCFNYRYSFVLSFILLIIAYDGYLLVINNSITTNEYIKTGVAILFLASLVLSISEAADKVTVPAISMDVILVCIVIALFARGYHSNKIIAGFLTVLIIYSSVVNSYYCLKGYVIRTYQSYGEMNALMKEAEAKINDDSFYRMDKSVRYGRCDPHLFSFNGLSNYSSTENVEKLEFIRRLGASHIWMWGRYNTNMSASLESLLGLKYIITDAANSKDYSQIGKINDLSILKNNYALPIVFPAESVISVGDENGFELQNMMWNSITAIDENVFEQNRILELSPEEKHVLNVIINNEGSAYICIPNGSYSEVIVNSNGIEKEIKYNEEYTDEKIIFYVGEYKEGDELTFTFSPTDENNKINNLDDVTCYTEIKHALKEHSETANSSELSIEEKKSSIIDINYTGPKRILASSIPYDKGWKAFDNGKEVKTYNNWDHFLAIELDDSNDHAVTLKFRPTGFHIGCIISILSLAFVAAYEAALYLKRRRS